MRSTVTALSSLAGEPSFQEPSFGALFRQLERARVLARGLVGAVEAAQEIGPCRVEVAVPVERQRIDEPKALRGACDLGDGDRAVQLDDGRGGEAGEPAV